MNWFRALATVLIAVVVTQTAWTDDKPKEEARITALQDKLVEKVDWKNSGFQTPQATAQTFLWATREKNIEAIRKCFDSPEKTEKFSDADKERLKKAGEVARAYQPLAIRTIDDDEVELKFKVTGWEDRPFVHKLKRLKGKWKLDSSSSTRIATW